MPALFAASPVLAQTVPPPPAAQNPSPMVETTRAHERVAQRDVGGAIRTFAGPGGRPVELWIPPGLARRRSIDVLIHFHGTPWLARQSLAAATHGAIAVVLNLGAGSGAYHRAFTEPSAFDSLLATAARETASALHRDSSTIRVGRVILSGYSAGHGAIRQILRDSGHFARVDAVLLIDGMHTSYVPEGMAMAGGGALDTTNLATFAAFARAAMRGEKRMLVTHSEIFPGTFASTTETADWLLTAIGLTRHPVLRWGPRRMQQLSEARTGRFELRGFAGNSAPDHVDQFHGMPEFLAALLR